VNTPRIERWIWILIYAGLIALGVGLAVQRSDASLGGGIAIGAVALIVVGVALIWVRSRIANALPPDDKRTP
jgi:undecaprenyl pyrophosphate phosphatase UppP